MEELKRIFNKLYVHKDVYFAEEVIIMSIPSFSTILKNTLVVVSWARVRLTF